MGGGGGRRWGGKVPQPVLVEARVRVIGRRRRRWRGDEVGQRDPLREGVEAHGVEVARGQGLGLVGAGVEVLGQLLQGAVQGAVVGGLEDAGGPHARQQAQCVGDLLGPGVRGQLAPDWTKDHPPSGLKQLTMLCLIFVLRSIIFSIQILKTSTYLVFFSFMCAL